jgi:hypothetical protein
LPQIYLLYVDTLEFYINITVFVGRATRVKLNFFQTITCKCYFLFTNNGFMFGKSIFFYFLFTKLKVLISWIPKKNFYRFSGLYKKKPLLCHLPSTVCCLPNNVVRGIIFFPSNLETSFIQRFELTTSRVQNKSSDIMLQ